VNIKSFIGLLLLLGQCSNQPSRAKFPGPIGRTSEFQRAENTQAVLGGAPRQVTINNEDEKKSLRGIARLAKGAKLPSKKFIVFISARPLQGGPPLAVSRLQVDSFPFRFSLTEANAMMAGAQSFEGFVDLTVRVDQAEEDGRFDPLTRQAGDLSASIKTKIGTQNIELNLK
jgi:hypothetical protein